MHTYGVTQSDILSAIGSHRSAIRSWSARKANGHFRISIPADKRAELISDHKASIRDLQILLMFVRFPNSTLPVAFSSEFTPIIRVSDNDNDVESVTADNDTNTADMPELITA